MSDMSFKQAKELVDKIELTELTLNKTAQEIQESSKGFNEALKHQERILTLLPKANLKLNTMRIVIGINIGFILGILVGKFIL
jgi:exonuclease VII small subunit